MTYPADQRYTIQCGRLYDPTTDSAHDTFPCEGFARWEVIGRDGLIHYACGSHINKVLSDIVGTRRVDLSVKDLRHV